MRAEQEMARNLLQQEPGRGVCHVKAANASLILEEKSRRHHETADEYQAVLAHLKPCWRVICCRDHLQWVIQRRKNSGGEWPWRAQAYCRTRKALLRLTASLCGPIDPDALTRLASLPSCISRQAVVREAAA